MFRMGLGARGRGRSIWHYLVDVNYNYIETKDGEKIQVASKYRLWRALIDKNGFYMQTSDGLQIKVQGEP
jgi:hypothetical protein